MTADYLLCLGIAFIYDPFYLLINHICHLIAIGLGMRQITANKYLIIIAATTESYLPAQTYRTELPCSCKLSGLFDILGRAGGYILKDQFLGDPSAQIYHNVLEHTAPGVEHLILLRKGHGIACGPYAGRMMETV